MAKFKAKSVIVLSRTKESKFWNLLRRGYKTGPSLLTGLYQTWLSCYKAIEDKGRITKIRVEVTRER